MNKYTNKLYRRISGSKTLGTKALRNIQYGDKHLASKLDWPKLGLLFTAVVTLSLLTSVHLLPDKISLRLGDVSSSEVRAARSVRFINSLETANQRQLARQHVTPVYDTDDSGNANAHRIVQEFFDRTEQNQSSISRSSPAKKQIVESLRLRSGAPYSDSQFRYLLSLSPAILQKIRDTSTRLVDEAMDREIREGTNDLEHAKQDIVNGAHAALSAQNASVLIPISQLALRPNRIYNRHKTEAMLDAAARAVNPVYDFIVRGDRVIGIGDKVTQKHLDMFMVLGLLNPRIEPTTGIAVCAIVASMVLLVVFYISRIIPALYADRRRLSLLTMIVCLGVFGLKIGAAMFGLSFSSGQLGYLGMMSVAAAGMLISVLIDRNLAVLVVSLLAVQSGLIMNHEIRFTVMTLMSSLMGIVTVGSVRRTNNLLATTVCLAATSLGMVWLLGMLLSDSLAELVTGSAWAVGSAMYAAFLYWFGVLMLEKPFGILTHTALLELSASDKPLLTHLCAIAPGTYAHSMMVGSLAEAGAQIVGADSLLCRVGGYYHDIGKTKRPEFFYENQRRENIHCRLSPSLSALFITAHVRDGVDLATEHKLPVEIRDIIAQHHGTTLIGYFYHQALTDCGGNSEAPPGLEERFRYPGPKPQTREAAIVMLADSVEAACRSIDKPSQDRLESRIHDVIRGKIEDGQLDECDLTFKDMKGISNAFLHVLSAMMHSRIDYPKSSKPGGRKPSETLSSIRPALSYSSSSTGISAEELSLLDSNAVTMLEAAAERDYPNSVDTANAMAMEFISEGRLNLQASAAPETHTSSSPLGLPMFESEVLYGRHSSEHAPNSDTNELPPSGSALPPKGRRISGIRSERGSDG